MIAIGGSIGAGLWIGTGTVLAQGGPASALIAYIFVGAILYCTVHAIGELATLYPVAGSFATFSTRFIDPAWGFAMGWNYAMNWLVVLPLEVTAGLKILHFWEHNGSYNIPEAVSVTIFLVAIFGINLCGVRAYGESEFGASLIKAAALFGFILLGIIINCVGNQTSGYIGLSLWTDPGAFNNGFKGFCSVLISSAFSFAGTELVGLSAAETMNPTKNIPRAVKQVFWRIATFYVVSVLIVGLIVRYDDIRLIGDSSDPSTSPFILAIQDAGLDGLDSVMNVVILVSVLSVANASFFASSRVLAALADQGQAPKALRYIDRRGRPIAAVCLAALVGLLSYMGTGVATDIVLDWLVALSGLSSIISWASICLSHIRFRQAWKLKGHSLDELVYRSPVGTVGSWLALCGLGLIIAAQVWVAVDPIDATHDIRSRVSHFFSSLLTLPVIFLFYFGFKLAFKTKWVKIEQIDIETGRYKMKGRHRRKEGGNSFLDRLTKLAI
ncbi:hypothetical protein N0V93_006590 [Gnomoniopsis smithogilvyi]|uniref:Amino acid permease/ SLC12A domain-containing protein n=1 Tax=Gnomoniopsis smithogilvyi TaxID=1191159 RepID=A0A9W8YRY8_9PEZI|nr:hypothetical protein N0V93_006590 [Gnomoniopsis smithogilvyi]